MLKWRREIQFISCSGKNGECHPSIAMDISPLIKDIDLDPEIYFKGYIERFSADICDRINRKQE
jgi:hypothetical protein